MHTDLTLNPREKIDSTEIIIMCYIAFNALALRVKPGLAETETEVRLL